MEGPRAPKAAVAICASIPPCTFPGPQHHLIFEESSTRAKTHSPCPVFHILLPHFATVPASLLRYIKTPPSWLFFPLRSSSGIPCKDIQQTHMRPTSWIVVILPEYRTAHRIFDATPRSDHHDEAFEHTRHTHLNPISTFAVDTFSIQKPSF
ncbi:hypothetical protein IWZ00DRAFT_25477 [Phyllosticta capitalensis]